MADDVQPTETPMQPQPNGADTGPAIGLISQYVKDLSFENPSAPACYQWTSAPQVDVQFNIGSTPVADGVFESLIKIDISSSHPEGQGYVVDLSYAGLFGVRNVPEDQVQAFMLAEAPRILFPFARRVIADAVRDGGFAPMLLEPIDFHGLYLAQREQHLAQNGTMGDTPVAGNA
jgi:preprotein translocase subunit SecB